MTRARSNSFKRVSIRANAAKTAYTAQRLPAILSYCTHLSLLDLLLLVSKELQCRLKHFPCLVYYGQLAVCEGQVTADVPGCVRSSSNLAQVTQFLGIGRHPIHRS